MHVRITQPEGTREMSDRVVLTFDNLGEASELERGTWPADEPLGRHPSVTEALPRLLDELDAHGLTATFFVEGINCELYPDAVREIAARGHEVGVHGWRHETWGSWRPPRARAARARRRCLPGARAGAARLPAAGGRGDRSDRRRCCASWATRGGHPSSTPSPTFLACATCRSTGSWSTPTT